MALTFAKLEACGNDFVVTRARSRMSAAQARDLCRRKTGIGADGLVHVPFRTGGGGAYRVSLYNADGSRAGFSGNGLRCAALFLARSKGVAGPFSLKTSGGTYRVGLTRKGSSSVWLECPIKKRHATWRSAPPPTDLPSAWTRRLLGVFHVNVGNPHLVLVSRGRPTGVTERLEAWSAASKDFPGGANASWVRLRSRARMTVTTWERGAGPTGACASACIAAGWVAFEQGWTAESVVAEQTGGDLAIEVAREALRITGTCRIIFEGTLNTRVKGA